MTQQESAQYAEKGKGNGKSRNIFARTAAALTPLATIATAIATIMTSAVAILGVVVHSKNAELHQASTIASSQAKQIKNQTRQIQQLEQAPSVTATTGQSATAGSNPGGPVTNVPRYLSDQTPTVNSGELSTGQQVIANEPYVHSLLFDCDAGVNGTPDEAFDVAGYSTLTAEVGVPDNMPNATGVLATVTFSNEAGQQVGQPVQVSLGHPVSVALPIKGVTQLGMTCDGRSRQTNQPVDGFQVAMGNAGIS